jgi:hypothetical protein
MNDFEVNPIEPTPPTESVPPVVPNVPQTPQVPQAPEAPQEPTPQAPVPSAPRLETKPPGGGLLSKLTPMKWILLILAIGVVAVGLVTLFSGSFSESGVILEIEGPDQIQSGEEVTYKVHYENQSDVRLDNVRLAFIYPADSVVVKDGLVRESITENIEIDSLGSGATGDIEFTAFVVGDTGDIKNAKARLSYKPTNIKSEFDEKADLATTITSFAVPLTLSAPPSAVSGQEVRYTLDYRNESDEDFEDLRIKFKYPEGFNPISFNPTPDIGEDVWNIDSLDKGEGSRITVTGTMIGREDEDKTVNVTLQRRVDGNDIDFEKTQTTTIISSPPLLINIVVNDRTDLIAHPGDKLKYDISFTNTSRSTLSGVNLIVRLEGGAHDSDTYSGEGFFNSSNNTIMWNASNIPVLANLQPGQSGEATFRIRVKDPLPASITAKNFFIKAITSLETTNVPAELGLDKLVVSKDLLTKISTNLNFEQTVHFSDPAAGFSNSGPVPPEVGQQTTYTIHWTLDGTSNDIVNAKIIGFLPPGVTWTGNTTVNANQPAVTHDSGTGKVTWNIEVIPAGTGFALPRYQAIFQVAITPSSAQQGRSVELIRQSEVEGQDGFTKERIERFAFPLTTDNVVDRKGEGAVQ